VIFGKEKEKFKLVDWNRELDFLSSDPVNLEKDGVGINNNNSQIGLFSIQ